MKLMLFSAALFTLLLSLPAQGASQGAKICNTDIDTLLRVHASRVFSPFTGHDLAYTVDEEYLVTRGGTAAVFVNSDRLPTPPDHGRTVAFGLAKPAALTALLNALAAVHVDTQTSCFQVNDVQATGILYSGTYEVSWFGPDGRENSFQIVFGNTNDSSLPDCDGEGFALDQAVSTFAGSLITNAATRVCP